MRRAPPRPATRHKLSQSHGRKLSPATRQNPARQAGKTLPGKQAKPCPATRQNPNIL